MGKHINSASRILNIFRQLHNQTANTPMIALWSDIFSIDEEDHHKKNFEISRCLKLLHDELTSINEKMENTDFSEELYKPYIQKTISFTSIQYLSGNWQSYKNNLTDDILLSLNFCSEIIPDEEAELEQEALDEILNLVNELEQELESSKIPSNLKNIISTNIDEIKKAIHSFNIVGIKAFESVMQSAYGAVVMNQDTYKEVQKYDEGNKLSKIFQIIQKKSSEIIKIDKTIQSGKNLYEYGVKVIELLS